MISVDFVGEEWDTKVSLQPDFEKEGGIAPFRVTSGSVV